MTQRLSIVALLLLAACGGHSSVTTPAPASTADRAVQEFMRAVADSNLAKMAELWGSSKGSAASTHEPADFQRRIVIMQAYLRGAQSRILSDDADATQPGRHTLQVELKRERCVKIIPFVVIRVGDQWLVNQVDLSAAGSPGRACDAAAATSP